MEGDFYVEYGRLDDYQREIIRTMFYNNEVVAGKAGTGKSLIALHKLARVPQDKTACLVVFTKSLKRYFEDGMKALGIEDYKVQYNEKWDHQHVDYLFVDECQDFTHDRITEFIGCCDKCFFFGDSEQTIMDFGTRVTQSVEDTAKQIGVMPHILYTNYRLTRENAALAEKVGGVDNLVKHCVRNGVKPRLIAGTTFDQQLDEIIRIVHEQKLTRVGILVPYNTEYRALCSPNKDKKLSVEYVRNYCNTHGMNVEYKMNSNYGDQMELDFHASTPKVVVWYCAKGLQFNDVFIPFCETAYDDEKRKALYVSVTRAYERLYLGYTGQPNPEIFPQVDSDYYTTTAKIEEI